MENLQRKTEMQGTVSDLAFGDFLFTNHLQKLQAAILEKNSRSESRV